ncbi:MAG: hypothetical protein PHE27_01775, partial [Alphaproteobacteria bacterium]|nr:hypothetical protein [Alphaproteobacteria bacterium]
MTNIVSFNKNPVFPGYVPPNPKVFSDYSVHAFEPMVSRAEVFVSKARKRAAHLARHAPEIAVGFGAGIGIRTLFKAAAVSALAATAPAALASPVVILSVTVAAGAFSGGMLGGARNVYKTSKANAKNGRASGWVVSSFAKGAKRGAVYGMLGSFFGGVVVEKMIGEAAASVADTNALSNLAEKLHLDFLFGGNDTASTVVNNTTAPFCLVNNSTLNETLTLPDIQPDVPVVSEAAVPAVSETVVPETAEKTVVSLYQASHGYAVNARDVDEIRAALGQPPSEHGIVYLNETPGSSSHHHYSDVSTNDVPASTDTDTPDTTPDTPTDTTPDTDCPDTCPSDTDCPSTDTDCPDTCPSDTDCPSTDTDCPDTC